jgi:hypothetical protein
MVFGPRDKAQPFGLLIATLLRIMQQQHRLARTEGISTSLYYDTLYTPPC